MAMAFRAISNIRHGVAGPDGVESEVLEFKYGEIVTGLDNATMKTLWDVGVLEKVDMPEPIIIYKDRDEAPPVGDTPASTPADAATPGAGGSDVQPSTNSGDIPTN
jgi:hypothetical protein